MKTRLVEPSKSLTGRPLAVGGLEFRLLSFAEVVVDAAVKSKRPTDLRCNAASTKK